MSSLEPPVPEENAPLLNSNRAPNDPGDEDTSHPGRSTSNGGGSGIPRGSSRRRPSSPPEQIYPSSRKFSQLEILLSFAVVLLLILTTVFAGLYAHGRSNKPKLEPPAETLPENNETEICLLPDCVLTAAAIISDMDPIADPCHDFWQYSCGGWVDKHVIPEDKGRFGYFDSLYEDNQKILKTILENENSPTFEDNGPILPSPSEFLDKINFHKLQSFYKSCMNETLIAERGIRPLAPILKDIFDNFPAKDEHSLIYLLQRELSVHGEDKESTDSKPVPSVDRVNLTTTLSSLTRIGVTALFEFSIEADAKNPEINALYLSQAGLGLPSKEYYEENDILTVYKEVITELLANSLNPIVGGDEDNTGMSSTEPVKISEDAELLGAKVDSGMEKLKMKEWEHIAIKIVEFEKKLANISLPAEEFSDPEAIYNPHTLPSLSELSPVFLWPQLIGNLIPDKEKKSYPEVVVLTSDKYFKELSELVTSTQPATLQFYLLWQTINTHAPHLNETFRKPLRRLQATIEGTDDSVKPRRWETCLKEVDDILGFMAGRFFVLKTFGGNSKNISDQLITSVRNAFIRRLPQIEWLDEETRKKAIDKVNKMVQKVGYPDSIPNIMDPKSLAEYYENLSINETEYFENIINGSIWLIDQDWAKIGKPVERAFWHMNPQTVNAYYNPTANEIVFPAGILQPPFFSANNPEYINYGAIGVVIGHELTHAFDNNGRKYDETGRLIQWWSNATIEAFQNKTMCFIDQYSKFTMEDGQGNQINVNGNLTLGENLADNGGLKEAYDTWSNNYNNSDPEKKANKLLPGLENLNRDQLFYLSFARIWCSKIRPEHAVERIRTDVHAPHKWRVNGVLQNSPHFAETFGCKKGSFMNPEKKCDLW